jgi:hypothetical protein
MSHETVNLLVTHKPWPWRIGWMVGYLFIVLRPDPAQEFFTYMETSPSPVKGCKIQTYAWRSGPLSREGSLFIYTCCDSEPRFFRSYPKDRNHSTFIFIGIHISKIEILFLFFNFYSYMHCLQLRNVSPKYQ